MHRRNIDELDGLRALMAWWVVAGHIATVFSDRAGILIHNISAVSVFMALSGFVIAELTARRHQNYGRFIAQRIARLWPAYVVALCFSTLTLGIQAFGVAHAPFVTAEGVLRVQGEFDAALQHPFAHAITHMFLLQGLVPFSLLPFGTIAILGVAWSLSVEFQFYLVAQPLMRALDNKRTGIFVCLVFAAVLYALGHHGPLKDNGSFLGHYVIWFAAGIAGQRIHSHADRKSWWIAGMVGNAAFLVAGIAFKDPGAVVWGAVMLCLLKPTRLNGYLSQRWLVRLGHVSYSTYLFHVPITFVLAAALDTSRLRGLPYAVSLVILTCLLTLIISFFSFRWIEQPGKQLWRWLEPLPKLIAGNPNL